MVWGGRTCDEVGKGSTQTCRESGNLARGLIPCLTASSTVETRVTIHQVIGKHD